MSRMFYSDNYKRYSNAELYKNAKGFGQFDLPHVVIYMGYDFGRGWTMGMEIEYEHGGTESAIEIEEEETGEYETEVERGGEVALEQFWIQKSFNKAFNLRMGHIIVPVGGTNPHHMPNEFFTVYRPEGESKIIPCTWHQTGISLWGEVSKLRYEVQFLPGLQADMFGASEWVGNNSVSPQTSVASDAISVGVEVGYDIFSQIPYMRQHHETLHIFGRYDYYDSMYKTQGSVVDNPCWGRQKITFGLNYSPIKDIVVKAEWSNRLFKRQFNNEPTISLGVTYCGFYKL